MTQSRTPNRFDRYNARRPVVGVRLTPAELARLDRIAAERSRATRAGIARDAMAIGLEMIDRRAA